MPVRMGRNSDGSRGGPNCGYDESPAPTGEIEIRIEEVTIQSIAQELPCPYSATSTIRKRRA